VISPKIAEIKEAADKLGLTSEINLEAHFPKAPWHKSGMLLVEKKEPKEAIIKKLAKQLAKIKSQQQATLPNRR
jgi:signal recognition particle subunit SEC65